MAETSFLATSITASGYGDNQLTLLLRDPNCLYAYWEISDDIKNAFIKEFGNELWEKSVPVLKITNITKQESFFVRINDFSNYWFINIEHAGEAYVGELGRKVSDKFFISIATSNYITSEDESANKNSLTYFANYKDIQNTMFEFSAPKICKDVVNKALLRLSSSTFYK